MAQRFSGPVPNQGPVVPPQQRYQQPQNPGMRQYGQQAFPVKKFLIKTVGRYFNVYYFLAKTWL